MEQGTDHGPKRPLLLKQVQAIRARLELAGNLRDLALFNVAIDSKLRGCDLVKLVVADLVRDEPTTLSNQIALFGPIGADISQIKSLQNREHSTHDPCLQFFVSRVTIPLRGGTYHSIDGDQKWLQAQHLRYGIAFSRGIVDFGVSRRWQCWYGLWLGDPTAAGCFAELPNRSGCRSCDRVLRRK